jgi:hypothetical protein
MLTQLSFPGGCAGDRAEPRTTDAIDKQIGRSRHEATLVKDLGLLIPAASVMPTIRLRSTKDDAPVTPVAATTKRAFDIPTPFANSRDVDERPAGAR